MRRIAKSGALSRNAIIRINFRLMTSAAKKEKEKENENDKRQVHTIRKLKI